MFGNSYTPVKIERDCAAVIVPEGSPVELPAGTIGYITQQLGGSFTVYVEGRLFRLAGDDADAIGKEPPPPPVADNAGSNDDVDHVVGKLLTAPYHQANSITVVDGVVSYYGDSVIVDDATHLEVVETIMAPAGG